MKALISDAHIANKGKWLNSDNVSVKLFLKLMRELPKDSDSLSISKNMVDKIQGSDTGASKDPGQKRKAISGKCFELLMAELLVRHSITPFYIQAELRHIPLSKFDFLCYHPEQPVIFSTKISLAERWRQASYEGDSLKRVYRKAECYLVTANKRDAEKRNKDIEEGDAIGIDKCFVMGESALIEKLDELSNRDFIEGVPQEPIIKGNPIVP